MLGVCVTVPGDEKSSDPTLFPNVGGHHDGIPRKFTKDFRKGHPGGTTLTQEGRLFPFESGEIS